jgi:hypothetical protein
MRVVNASQASGLIKLKDIEHLGVTDRSRSQSQQYPDREKQPTKSPRSYFKAGSLAFIRLFYR